MVIKMAEDTFQVWMTVISVSSTLFALVHINCWACRVECHQILIKTMWQWLLHSIVAILASIY
jgi:hypothetical protein